MSPLLIAACSSIPPLAVAGWALISRSGRTEERDEARRLLVTAKKEREAVDLTLSQTRLELATTIERVAAAQKALDAFESSLGDTRRLLKSERGRCLALTNQVERTEAELVAKSAYAGELAASVNRLEAENNNIYDEFNRSRKEHTVRGIELDYWHHFAGRVLHDSRSRLGKVRSFLDQGNSQTSADDFLTAAENIEFVTDLLELGEARDIAKRVRELRAKPTARPFNALPRLRKFVNGWATQLGAQFESVLPATHESMLVLGAWAHIELLLTNVFENAKKHGLRENPIKFECVVANFQVRFTMTNYSATPVSEAVSSARLAMTAGDPIRPRFGLFLMEKIAEGYRGFVDIENVGTSPEGAAHCVVTTIKLPTDG